jgi:hypothetical protein
MGCHTWFSVPYKTDKKEIISIAQKWLDDNKYMSKGHRRMYQWAIDNEVCEPITELASFDIGSSRDGEFILYKNIEDFSVEKYNLENGTNIDKYDYEACEKANIESYSNEPRIGGYPDKVIRSYDEMIEFMKVGYTDEKGNHYDFYYDEDRIDNVMSNIKKFFIKHPDGIITFG